MGLCYGTCIQFPKMYAYIRACSRGAGISTGASGGMIFEEDNEVLRRVKGKALETHAVIIDDNPCLPH